MVAPGAGERRGWRSDGPFDRHKFRSLRLGLLGSVALRLAGPCWTGFVPNSVPLFRCRVRHSQLGCGLEEGDGEKNGYYHPTAANIRRVVPAPNYAKTIANQNLSRPCDPPTKTMRAAGPRGGGEHRQGGGEKKTY